MKTEQLSAIEQIKAEFMERWGVDVKIQLNLYNLDEEKAEEIVSAYAGVSFPVGNDTSKWFTNKDFSNFATSQHLAEGFEITAFIK